MQYSHLKSASTVFLTGFGQIMLQASALSGALFLAGILLNSVWMALGALLGGAVGLGVAWLCAYDRAALIAGAFGFNGALVGIAISITYAPSSAGYLLIILGAALSSWLMQHMLRRAAQLPPFTTPFILATWAMLLVAHLYGGMEGAHFSPALQASGDGFAVLRGLGQVMFQDSWLSGLLFFLGLVLHSRPAAAWALLGSAIGLLAARSLGYPENMISSGIFGFNGALTGIALGSRFTANPMLPLLGIILSALLLRLMQLAGLPALTAPFVLSTWALIFLSRWRPSCCIFSAAKP